MKSVLINKKENIEIKFFMAESENGDLVIFDNEANLNIPIKQETKREEKVTLRKPTYRDNVIIMSGSVVLDGENVKVDPTKLRYERFKLLLVDWTFVDDNGTKIPTTEESIDDLNPDIAGAILTMADKYF